MESNKPVILIVDDTSANIKILESVLKDDYRLVARKSGEQALNYFENLKGNIPDLILLDIIMPGINGFEVCARLKQNPQFQDIPVIFISTMIDSKEILQGFESGGVDYIAKPFNPAELKARVNTHITLKKIREDLLIKNVLLEKKMIEIEEKTEQLRQKDVQLMMMDRIAGIGTLASGIAHEINNPLSFVKNGFDLAKKNSNKLIETLLYWDNRSEAEFLLKDYKVYLNNIDIKRMIESFLRAYDRIERGIQRIMLIVNSLKSFSRLDREKTGKLDINQSINEAIEILNPNYKNISFEKQIEQLPIFDCITDEINQSLMHVIKNAIDAIEKTGNIKINTSYKEDEQKIYIHISDNGKGMSDDVIKKAFNPFFTTKPVGSGTGIGLTIAENIIKKHNGTINLKSKEGEGTIVTIIFPCNCG